MKQVGLIGACQKLTRHVFGGGLAALLYLVLQTLAVSPSLHQLLHDDSHQPDHQCPVKLLADAQVDVESGTFGGIVPSGTLAWARPSEPEPTLRLEFRQPPERAPPARLS